MPRGLQESRIIVTGASSGIGRCLAEQLVRLGSRLVLVGRSQEKLADLARKLAGQGSVFAVPADISQPGERTKIIDAASRHLGGLDVLINNAGIGSWAHFADSSEAILRQIMEVNFFAPAELIRLAIPLLKEGRAPAVVNVSSMCGRRGMPSWSEYSASKHALCGLTEALRGELARFDIDTLLIVPGLTNTGLADHLLKKTGRADIDFAAGMPAEEVAARIIDSLRRNKTETVVGRDARWMLLFNRFFPRLLDRLIARKIRQLYPGGDVTTHGGGIQEAKSRRPESVS